MLFEDAVETCRRKRILALLGGGAGVFLAGSVLYLVFYGILSFLALRGAGEGFETPRSMIWILFGAMIVLYPLFGRERRHPGEIGSEYDTCHWNARYAANLALLDFVMFGSRLLFHGIRLTIEGFRLWRSRPESYLPVLSALYHEPHRIELEDLEQALGVSRAEFLPVLFRLDAILLLQHPPAVALTSLFREKLDGLLLDQ